jgi:hypothetical protein
VDLVEAVETVAAGALGSGLTPERVAARLSYPELAPAVHAPLEDQRAGDPERTIEAAASLRAGPGQRIPPLAATFASGRLSWRPGRRWIAPRARRTKPAGDIDRRPRGVPLRNRTVERGEQRRRGQACRPAPSV